MRSRRPNPCPWGTDSSAAFSRPYSGSRVLASSWGFGSRSTSRSPISAPCIRLLYLRATIHVTLVTSFLLGSLSAVLRANKALALTGIGATLAGAVLGGSRVPVTGPVDGWASWLAVDFFVLNLVLYSAVFIPLERLFALRAGQPVFRRHWLVDLTYFFINSLLIEVLTIFTLKPALILFDWARVGWVSGAVGSLPLLLQVPVIVCVADFTQVPGCTGRFTPCRFSGLFTPSITPLRRWTGLRARDSTWWMSFSPAG